MLILAVDEKITHTLQINHHHHRRLVLTILVRLHEFCYSVYSMSNPWIGSTSLYLSLLLLSMSSSAYPFPLKVYQLAVYQNLCCGRDKSFTLAIMPPSSLSGLRISNKLVEPSSDKSISLIFFFLLIIYT
eukprot:TRINITY_DN14597_c0_g3_i2.p1 TRINITY_DN14597_c0_g3~~TRINITY_DN14597_c0_g3_i2.p1  ORF type:complete len:130 (-),score=0.53 TRINITY_DN14597_c0_g3_i2:273-662(-)